MLHIDTPAIDFGVIEIGKERSTPIQITNVSEVGLKYEFTCTGHAEEYVFTVNVNHLEKNPIFYSNHKKTIWDQKKAF